MRSTSAKKYLTQVMNTACNQSNLLISLGISMAFVLMTSCASTQTSSPSQGDYIPSVKVIASGFRPQLPYYNPEVTYQSVEDLSEKEIADIHRNFVIPLTRGIYHSHIAAIVIYGSYEQIQTRYGIWLHDGRHLDSGYLFLSDPSFSNSNLGRSMHQHATSLLRKKIPNSKLEKDLKTQISDAARG